MRKYVILFLLTLSTVPLFLFTNVYPLRSKTHVGVIRRHHQPQPPTYLLTNATETKPKSVKRNGYTLLRKSNSFVLKSSISRCDDVIFARLSSQEREDQYSTFLVPKKTETACRFVCPFVELLPAAKWKIDIIVVRRSSSSFRSSSPFAFASSEDGPGALTTTSKTAAADGGATSAIITTTSSTTISTLIANNESIAAPSSSGTKGNASGGAGQNTMRTASAEALSASSSLKSRSSCGWGTTHGTSIEVDHQDYGGCRPVVMSPLLSLVVRYGVQTFPDMAKYFEYPYERVMSVSWKKVFTSISGKTGASEHGEERRCSTNGSDVCHFSGRYGFWSRAGSKGSRAGDLRDSHVDISLLSDPVNVDRGLQHVFIPFECCSPVRFLPDDELYACTQGSRLMIAGDSRAEHIALGLQAWLGEDAIEFLELHKPYRLGIRHAFVSNSGKALRRALRQKRTIIINSLLHDVADFYRASTRYDDVMLSWRDWATCDVTGCNATLASECGCRKTNAVQAYLDAMLQLKEEIARAREERPEGSADVYWLSMHKRPPTHNEKDIFAWQTADFVWDLENFAAQVLSGVGVRHIDIRPMLLASPPGAWDDQAHFGINERSFLLRMVMYGVVSEVCYDRDVGK